jgi:hypothetical protein
MNLKYYLRGLGLGIIVTALVMGFSGSRDKMSDAEIRSRAEALGMTDTSAVLTKQETDTSKKTVTDKKKTASASSSTSAKTETSSSQETAVSTSSASTTQTAVSTTQAASTTSSSSSSSVSPAASTSAASMTLSIVSGDSSYSVAKKLEAAGFVDSAADYDRYLCSNGYDKKIHTGTYTISAGESGQEIAEKITGK